MKIKSSSLIGSFRGFIHHNELCREIRRAICLKNKTYCDADKYKILYVDPNKIVNETHSKMGGILVEPNAVYDGCWDKATVKFRKRVQMKSLIKHFEDGKSWPKTTYYQREKHKIENGGEWRNCSSIDELNNRFAQYDELYDRIKNDGFKTQAQLLREDPDMTEKLNNESTETKFNEIGINIGRNGELIWQCRGQHRLCIAQILGLNKIPVRVHTRHQKWQKIRKKVRSTKEPKLLEELTKEELNHPDLRPLLV